MEALKKHLKICFVCSVYACGNLRVDTIENSELEGLVEKGTCTIEDFRFQKKNEAL